MAKKETAKKEVTVKTEKKPKRELPALSAEAQVQFTELVRMSKAMLAQLETKTPSMGQSHLHGFRRDLNKKISEMLRARRGNPAARKRNRLEARMAKLQAELAALKAEGK